MIDCATEMANEELEQRGIKNTPVAIVSACLGVVAWITPLVARGCLEDSPLVDYPTLLALNLGVLYLLALVMACAAVIYGCIGLGRREEMRVAVVGAALGGTLLSVVWAYVPFHTVAANLLN